jgi:hypothetical protein
MSAAKGFYTEVAETQRAQRGERKNEERFLTAQADTFAGANVKEKTSACFLRNDVVGGRIGGG